MRRTGCRIPTAAIRTVVTILLLVSSLTSFPKRTCSSIDAAALENFVYQGGDDCLAFKPNSTMITARNVSCYGGSGIAFGSIAQYEGVVGFFGTAHSRILIIGNQMDIIEDIVLEDIKLYPSSQCPGYQGIYFKSWIG